MHSKFLSLRLGFLLSCVFANAFAHLDFSKLPFGALLSGPILNDGNEPLGEPLTSEEFNLASELDDLDIPEASSDIALNLRLFQGDIQIRSDSSRNGIHHSAIKDPKLRWPGAVVPYVIAASFNNEERLLIARAMSEIQELSCVRFVGKTSEFDYIKIFKDGGCYSSVGRVGGKQTLSLGNGCVYKGIIQHELMHALGFWHEQSRSDRDSFVTILWSNIIPHLKYNFKKHSPSVTSDLGLPYDYSSLMHYGKYDFTQEGKPTIIPKEPNVQIGQRRGLSKSDITGLNLLYKCQSTITPVPTARPTTIPTTTAPPPVICIDRSGRCRQWASKGHCDISSVYMSRICPKTCNICTKDECEDKNRFCSYWSNKGECRKNPTYMKIFCKKSCGLCTSDEPPFEINFNEN